LPVGKGKYQERHSSGAGEYGREHKKAKVLSDFSHRDTVQGKEIWRVGNQNVTNLKQDLSFPGTNVFRQISPGQTPFSSLSPGPQGLMCPGHETAPAIQILSRACVGGGTGLHSPTMVQPWALGPVDRKRSRHFRGLHQGLVALFSLIGRKWPGQASDPTTEEGLYPSQCLPTYLLPRVLPTVYLGPEALLHLVSDKHHLGLSEGMV